MAEKTPFKVEDPKLAYIASELAILQKIPIAKLKLYESAMRNLADVAKNSAPLNDAFSSMKEGSMMATPMTVFLKLLGASTTMASVDSMKELLDVITDPDTRNAISELGKGFGQIVSGGLDFIKFFVDFDNSIKSSIDSFARANAEFGDFVRDIGTSIKWVVNEIRFDFDTLFKSAREWRVVTEEFESYFAAATEAISRRTQSEYGR